MISPRFEPRVGNPKSRLAAWDLRVLAEPVVGRAFARPVGEPGMTAGLTIEQAAA